ncbi:hypothetical protein EDB80DRAFT_685436 [Ilyonectria destructans]|nr:hypothetical protein EDB80DRAFT_685436 [Ilyonectria destructans]
MQSPPHQTPQRTSQRTPSTTLARPSNKTRLLQRERLHLRVRFPPSASTSRIEQFFLLQFCPMRHCPISNLHLKCVPAAWRGEGRKRAKRTGAELSVRCGGGVYVEFVLLNLPGGVASQSEWRKMEEKWRTRRQRIAVLLSRLPAMYERLGTGRLISELATLQGGVCSPRRTASIAAVASHATWGRTSKGFSASATSLVKASGAYVSPRHGIDSAPIDRRRGQAVEMIARKWVAADWDDPVLDRESHAWAPAFPFSSVQSTEHKSTDRLPFLGNHSIRAFASAASIRIYGCHRGFAEEAAEQADADLQDRVPDRNGLMKTDRDLKLRTTDTDTWSTWTPRQPGGNADCPCSPPPALPPQAARRRGTASGQRRRFACNFKGRAGHHRCQQQGDG